MFADCDMIETLKLEHNFCNKSSNYYELMKCGYDETLVLYIIVLIVILSHCMKNSFVIEKF